VSSSPPRALVLATALAAALSVAAPAHAGGSGLAPAPPRFAQPPALERAPVPPIAWRDPGAALNEARRDKKLVLVDVEVTWSAWCTRMQRTTYADPGVREDIARSFVPARLDAEEDDRRVYYEGRPLSHRGFADRFRVSTYPTTVFLLPDGTPITRVPGYVAPARFRTLLRFVAEGHYRKTTWEEFAGPPPDADEVGP
jgi:thioredoxin-related protein